MKKLLILTLILPFISFAQAVDTQIAPIDVQPVLDPIADVQIDPLPIIHEGFNLGDTMTLVQTNMEESAISPTMTQCIYDFTGISVPVLDPSIIIPQVCFSLDSVRAVRASLRARL